MALSSGMETKEMLKKDFNLDSDMQLRDLQYRALLKYERDGR